MRGIALSGGGARGFAHLGVLAELEAAGIRFDAVAGASMGAILGAFYAAGHDPRALIEALKGVHWTRFFSLNPGRGVFSKRRLLAFLRENLPPRFEDLERPFLVSAVNLETGALRYLSRGDLPLAVVASAAHPLFLGSVEFEGERLADGGILDNLPVGGARRLGAREVWAVDVGPEDAERIPAHVLAEARRATDLMSRALVRTRLALDPPEHLIRPELKGFGVESFGRLLAIAEAGKKAARAYLEALA